MFDPQGLRKYLSKSERRAYLEAAMREPDDSKRSFCLALFYTGCRISEALNVTGASFDPSLKYIVFETLKRRRRGVFRAVPIPDDLALLLGTIIAAPDKRIWPFSRSTAYRLIKKLLKQAQIAGRMSCPKGLRHGFGVACIGNGIPLPRVQKWLGHARPETTAIYLDVIGEEERDLAKRLWNDSAN